MAQASGRLQNKVAIVTGGTLGIGQGIVLRFLKEGASVVYCSRNPANNAENEELIGKIPGARERARFVVADVGDRDQMFALVQKAVDDFGRIDIVVNNAQGIAPLKPIEEKPDADYAMTLRTGFYHSLWTSQAALPYMKAQRSGRIINFSSHWNIWGQTFSSDYNITKSANESLTRSMAHEWGQYGITVNCITPAGDSFAYRYYKTLNPESCAETERTVPMRRMGDCEIDIAGAVLGLVSDNGRFITGQVFCVDGGTWAASPVQQHNAGTDIHANRGQKAEAG